MRSRGDFHEHLCSRPQHFSRDNNFRTGFRGNKDVTRGGFKPRKYEGGDVAGEYRGEFPEKKVESKFVEDEWTKTQVTDESSKRGGKKRRNERRGRRNK